MSMATEMATVTFKSGREVTIHVDRFQITTALKVPPSLRNAEPHCASCTCLENPNPQIKVREGL